MSWHYLQEQEEDFSLQNYLDGIQSADVKYRSTQEKSCYKDKEMDTYQSSLYGMMSQPLMEDLGMVQLMLFQEVSPVKTYQQEEKEKALKEKGVAYGKNMQESLEKLDLSLSLLKTPLYLEVEDLTLSSKTLMNWGMMQDGVCLGLGNLVQHINAIDYGLLDATPTCVMPLERTNPILEGRVFLLESGRPRKMSKKGTAGSLNWNQLMSYKGVIPTMELCEHYMGWPIGWTDKKPLEMDKYQSWLQMHGKY